MNAFGNGARANVEALALISSGALLKDDRTPIPNSNFDDGFREVRLADPPLTVQGDIDFVPFIQGSAEGTLCESPARKCRVRAR